MKYMNKIGAAAVSVALALICLPVSAIAAEKMAPVEKKTITWTQGEERPAFSETITIGGETYTLAGEPEVKETKQIVTAKADYTDWKECWPSDLNTTIASFGETYHYDAEGYEGDIPRTGLTYAAIEATETSELNATRTWTGLPTNDVTQIPATVDEETEWGHMVVLARAGLEWRVDTVDERGFPKTYTAFAIYRGMDSREVIDHYRVEATYEGDVKSKEPVTTFEATLSYRGPQVLEPERDRGEEFPIGAAVAAAVAAVAAATGVIVPLWRRKGRVRFVHVSWDKDKKRATRTTVGSAKIAQSGSECMVDAGNVELNVLGMGNYCAAEVPAKYVGCGYTLTINQQGRVIYQGAIDAPEIKIVASK